MAFPKPVLNERALLIESKKGNILVVADFHIGFEYELMTQGLRIPSQTEGMARKLNSIIASTKADRLVIIGDLKHKVPGTSYQELREIPSFLDGISCDTIELVAGNHDAELEYIVPKKVGIRQSSGMIIEAGGKKFGLFHGHAWPSREIITGCDYLVCAHLHPFVSIKDALGGVHREPCWFFSSLLPDEVKKNYGDGEHNPEMQEVVVMPPFNPMLGGVAINEIASFDSFFSCVDFDEGEVFLLDGTSLGQLKNFRQQQ